MLTLNQGLKLSAIIDKMGLKIINPKASQEEVGADMLMQVIAKAHLAEQEIYKFVADAKSITAEEAKGIDLIGFIKELVSDRETVNFFNSAVRLKGRE